MTTASRCTSFNFSLFNFIKPQTPCGALGIGHRGIASHGLLPYLLPQQFFLFQFVCHAYSLFVFSARFNGS